MTAPAVLGACPACGAGLAGGARFCSDCGTDVAALYGSTYAPPYGDPFAVACRGCGGNGARLPAEKAYCAECRWLRPLCPGYAVDIEAFLWRLDADAMNVLRSLGPLTAAAHAVSERVGRPWFEASVNGLRLGERQLPDVFATAIRAARIMGLPYLPEIYVSGEQMWDATTLGTDGSAFIVLGSVLTNFRGDDLLFILGREMGHVRAGHALWKTVMQFLSGRARHRSIMGEGVLRLLNPTKLVEGAIDAPLMAWARHAEITADRAGMLVCGKEDVARRVLTTWTLKSFPLQARINVDAWLEQENAIEGEMTRLSEWTLSSTPYLAGRLRLLHEFAGTETLRGWRTVIAHWAPPEAPPAAPNAPNARNAPNAPNAVSASPTPRAAAAPDPATVRLVCPKCREGMRIPRTALEGGAPVNVRCPNADCRAVLTVSPKAAAPSEPSAPHVPPDDEEPLPESRG